MEYQKHQKTVDLFLDMVQTDSPSFAESAMCDYIEKYIAAHRWDCKIDRQQLDIGTLPPSETARLAPHEKTAKTEQLIVVIPANDESKDPIYLSSHIDTVEPGKGICPVLRDDKIYSEGETILGADDKAGVASILEAVDEVLQKNLPHGKLVLAFTALEERGLFGAKMSNLASYGVKYGYVFDAAGPVGGITARSQYNKNFRINIKVKDIPTHAHSFLVPNALTVAGRMIAKLPIGCWNDKDYTFFQVVRMSTSSQPGYGVPDGVMLIGIARSFLPEELSLLTEQVKRIAESFNSEKVEVTVGITPKVMDGYDITRTEVGKLMLEKSTAAMKAVGLEPNVVMDGLGGSDASAFMQQGVPSVCLSCGMEEMHCTNEWIRVEDLHLMTEVILQLIAMA